MFARSQIGPARARAECFSHTVMHSARLGAGSRPWIEKRHLIIARVLRQRAEENQIQCIDMGTDYSYPFYDAYKPTQNALRALSENTSDALHYSFIFRARESSLGIPKAHALKVWSKSRLEEGDHDQHRSLAGL
jgi:hypothetical protein